MNSYAELARLLLAAKNGQQVDRERVDWLATRCENALYELTESLNYAYSDAAYAAIEIELARLDSVYTKLAAVRKELGL